MKQQVPTNNTADASAGYRSTDRNAADSMGIELGASLIQSGSDGDLLAKALGLSPSVFAHVGGADGAEQRHASLMQAALLALCDSPLLRQLLGTIGADVLRDHVTKFVRARGPSRSPYRQPALRPAAGGGTRPLDLDDRPGPRQRAGHLVEGQRLTRRGQIPQALQTTVESNPVVLLAQDANASGTRCGSFPRLSTQQPPDPQRLSHRRSSGPCC